MSAVLGLITARGGSKSIPRKNLAELAGKPLIAWTIEAALASTSLDRVIVSTDDSEIAAVSRELGADVPFMRPPELARDNSGHYKTVAHAVQALGLDSASGGTCGVVVLQPTSPFRSPEDIDAATGIGASGAPAVVSVTETHHHPYLVKRLDERGELSDFIEKGVDPGDPRVRRQSLPPAYVINGAIYLLRVDALLSSRTLLPPGTVSYVMPPERSLQIDSPWDLYLARLILGDPVGYDVS